MRACASAGAHRGGAGARADGDGQHVAAVHGDDRRHAGARAAHRVAGRRRVVGVDEVERELAPEHAQGERERRRRPRAPRAVAARPRRRDEGHVVDAQPVELGAQRLAQRGDERARVAAAQRRPRRHGPVQHEHPHLRAGVARGERLPVRPDAEHRVGRARVVLGDDGDAHGHRRLGKRIEAAGGMAAQELRVPAVILLLHNRYRVPGGEERAVEDLAWLVRTELGEEVEVLERDSALLGRGRAALGLLRGGLAPDDVAAAVRRTGARVVHAHNVQPSLGWRALAAARDAGARVVLHLHNYRLVCAVGTCFTRGEDCTRCHGRNTLPGVRLNCRGGSRAESAAYGAGLALWQRRLAASADAFVVPSAFALRRLEQLGAPLGGRARVIPSVQRTFAERSRAADGEYALYAGRLAAEKGVADAIAACRLAGVPLVVAGDGPEAAALRSRARLRALHRPHRAG